MPMSVDPEAGIDTGASPWGSKSEQGLQHGIGSPRLAKRRIGAIKGTSDHRKKIELLRGLAVGGTMQQGSRQKNLLACNSRPTQVLGIR